MGLIELLSRENIEDEEVRGIVEALREGFLNPEWDDEDMAEMAERQAELEKIIPAELQDLKEAPTLSVPADEMCEMMKNHIAAK